MEQMQMNKPDIYDAALYLRLSKDDVEEGGAKSESNSIANQRELLRSFVKSQQDIQIFDIYVDDGYSGGNFDRPEFKRMTADIEAGKSKLRDCKRPVPSFQKLYRCRKPD